MLLTHSDLEFISLETGLSESDVIKLTEVEKDLYLLIEAISDKESKSLISFISFPLFCHINVFKESKELPYDILEKAYVANSLNRFIELQNIQPYFLFEQKATDLDYGCYLLILVSVFRDIFGKARCKLPSINYYSNLGKIKFAKAKPDLSKHFDSWVLTLNKVSKRVGLSKQMMEKIELPNNPLKSGQKLLE